MANLTAPSPGNFPPGALGRTRVIGKRRVASCVERFVLAFAAAADHFLPALRRRNASGGDRGPAAGESRFGEDATGARHRKIAGDEGEAMEIIRHLSNEELTDLTVESDQRSLRSTLEALPEWARASTDRPRRILAGTAKCCMVTYRFFGEPGRDSTGSALAVAGVVGRDRTGTAGWIHARSRFSCSTSQSSAGP